MKNSFYLLVLVCFSLNGQDKYQKWLSSIEHHIPTETTVKAEKKKVLLFSLATGFKHHVIPYVDVMMARMAEKTGAFEITISNDIDYFSKEKIAQFDAIILNNNCSDRKERNLFRDVLINKKDKFGKKYKNLSTQECDSLAAQFEENLLEFVHRGKGLMVLHGAINMLNNSERISKMIGGSFAYHPKFQTITLKLVDSGHPMLKAFDGKEVVYDDEPYILNKAYKDFNFQPLLEMDTEKLIKIKPSVKEIPRYMAWIKKHGKGRVFYSAPGHSEKTYERADFLQFYLDGLQYTLGDLKCDDTPLKTQ
jgi:uncharacterized protein